DLAPAARRCPGGQRRHLPALRRRLADRLKMWKLQGLLPYSSTASRPARLSWRAARGDAGDVYEEVGLALTKEAKQEHVSKFGKHDGDTGSPEVQIAMLSQRINELTEHLR